MKEETKNLLKQAKLWVKRVLYALLIVFVTLFIYWVLPSSENTSNLSYWIFLSGLCVLFVPLIIYILFFLGKHSKDLTKKTRDAVTRNGSAKYILFGALVILLLLFIIPNPPQWGAEDKKEEGPKIIKFTICFGSAGEPSENDFLNLPKISPSSCYGARVNTLDISKLGYSYQNEPRRALDTSEGMLTFECQNWLEEKRCAFFFESSDGTKFSSGKGYIEPIPYRVGSHGWRGIYETSTTDSSSKYIGKRGRVLITSQ